MINTKPITVAIADDNFIFRQGLNKTISSFEEFSIVINEEDCEVMFSLIEASPVPPAICIIDMAMPDGYKILKQMKEKYPSIKVLILSMLNNELSIIRTIKIGANGFLLKGSSSADLREALTAISKSEYHYPEKVQMHQTDSRDNLLVRLSYTELEMLSLSCTEMNMRQIAEQMNLSLSAAEKCKEDLLRKLNVKSRIGLVLFAMNMGVQPS
ncbi:MAG TPA: response regulator transcription factor [Flavipsychrobacter sp.]|nr:response regulator transcription factor [Flavipsychrobacter sp.]